jgi:acetyl esterase
LRIFRPADPPADPPGVYVNFHGGGYVMDLTAMDDPVCRILAAESGAVIVNAAYVVAPQHPFPAPVDHAYATVAWAAANGGGHGWDGTRLAVGGQSAGGGLAAAVARLALERQAPDLRLQVLHYPPLDLATPIRQKHSPRRKPVLRPWMGDVFDTAYAPDPASRADRLISPAGAADRADLHGIAPAIVITAGDDILRDEGQRYAERLRAAGALAGLRDVTGADHGYDGSDDELALASYRYIAAELRRALAPG